MKAQSVATIRKVCLGIFRATFKQLSTRLDIYNLIASAAPSVQERIIAEVEILKARGQELYKCKRKLEDDGEAERRGKKMKHPDVIPVQTAGTPDTEMEIEHDQITRCVTYS